MNPMIWFVSLVTVIFAVGTIGEKNEQHKKIYAAVTIGGLITLGIIAVL